MGHFAKWVVVNSTAYVVTDIQFFNIEQQI